LLFVVLLTGTSAYATTDCSAGVLMASGGFNWVDYSAETLTEQKTTWDCWSLDSLSATTLTFSPWYSEPGFEIRGISGYATRNFTVPTNGGGHYTVSMDVDLVDPHDDYYNQLTGTVIVYHPATSTNTFYSLYYRNGTQGESFSSPYVDIYNVADGDTITIYIQGAWSFDSDSHTRFSNVHLDHDLNF
jgi:hypothetical protein